MTQFYFKINNSKEFGLKRPQLVAMSASSTAKLSNYLLVTLKGY